MQYKTMKPFDDEFENEAALRHYVKECDVHLDDEIALAMQCVIQTQDLRLFGLTGPTCSGKTTAARKITAELEARGLRVHVVSVDDFYFDKEYLLRRVDNDPNIEIDYDSEETIDIGLLEEQTENLLTGRKTFLPKFDFRSGKRVGGEVLIPHSEDVFLFEGIQILYPRVNAILNRRGSYKSIYIAPQSALRIGDQFFSPNEIRLMRRLVRDYLHRATEPAFTFYLWKSVRENEEKNIFPYVDNCDARIDSTIPYGISMLKPYLEHLMKRIPSDAVCFSDAVRILSQIREVPTVPHLYMTENSLYKEFI